jgi:BASS family bile acid:Na+ symporter
MPILKGLTAALAWLGRRGTRALALSVFIGLSLPQLAAYVKPFLGVLVFVMLLSSYLRTDPGAFVRHFKSPGLAGAASAWVMVVTPLLFGAVYTALGLRETAPALYQIMILQLAIAPITSSPAFAALMGLDVALSLVTLIVSSAISPFSTAGLSYLFLGSSMLSPVELGLKLFLFFAASGTIAYAIRRVAGQPWIERKKEMLDGVNVMAAFVFAIAAMDGVPRHFIDDPLWATGILALVTAVIGVLIGLSLLVFMRAGINRALVIGLLAGFRNLGVVMAAIGSTLPDLAWFYFAMVQFPIYLMPLLLKPLVQRFAEKR